MEPPETANPWDDIHHVDKDASLEFYGRVRNGSNGSPPLAILLGWLKSKEKHVRKYARFYQALNYNTVWMTAPSWIIYAQDRKHRQKYVESLCRFVQPYTDGGVILSPFSNGGAFLLREIWDSADEDVGRLRQKVCATCFDSCPAFIGPFTGARALLRSSGNDGDVGKWATVHCRNLYKVGASLISTGDIDDGFWRTMKQIWFGKRYGELFVFSDDDPLCDAKKVWEFTKSRPERPKVLHFERCGHCVHGMKFPKEYFEALKDLHLEVVNPWRTAEGLPPISIRVNAKL